MAVLTTVVASQASPRSYNIDRMWLIDLTATETKNGYICGYEDYAYVSKGEQYMIVNAYTGQSRGPYWPQRNTDDDAALGHGKAFRWAPDGLPGRIHLVLPSYGDDVTDAGIYIIDVDDWGNPECKGRIQGVVELFRDKLYSAFVPSIIY